MENWFVSHCWLIPLLPFFSFALLGTLFARRAPQLTAIAATVAVWVSCFLAWGLAHAFLRGGVAAGSVPSQFEWIHYQNNLIVHAGILVDSLSLLLMVVVTTVSALVHLYSLSYMAEEEGKGRFFVFLNLFTASMLGLVCAPNLLQLFACWELVGASSFLLIGFYFTRPAAVAASKKAFIVTRFADLGLLLGILILGGYGVTLQLNGGGSEQLAALLAQAHELQLQPLDFGYLSNPIFLELFSQQHILGVSALTLVLILIFAGAAGKSAMFPLHIWLPDAMEGPTPVSALIHAATMVVAGVYLVARLFPLYAFSPTALAVVATVGAFTCLFAALIGCTQDDLKRILAFSTLSQLGYMMLALGVASTEHPLGFSASMFHLFTHAFFKAELFLCAGVLIHLAHTNSIWEMGGIARKLPLFHLLFLCALLAICGVYPFAGFFSKDEILLAALESGHPIIFTTALCVAGLTAFYMSRLYFLCFWGKSRNHHLEHVHGVPFKELLPIGILAVLSVVAGFIPVPELVFFGLEPSEPHHASLVPLLGSVMALGGIGSAWLLYVANPALRDSLVSGMRGIYQIVREKFYIDEVYLFVVHRVIIPFVSTPCAWFDRHVVDGGVNLSGAAVRGAGRGVSRLQTGQLQTYGAWLFNGLVVLLLLFWLVGR